MGISMRIPYLSVAVGAVLMIIEQLRRTVMELKAEPEPDPVKSVFNDYPGGHI